MIRLEHEEELDFYAWSRRLLKTTWVFLLCVLLAELAIFAFYMATGGFDDVPAYLRTFILFPTVVNFTLFGICHIVGNRFLKKCRIAPQAYLYMGCICIICAFLTFVHNYITVMQAIMCLPIALSLTYADRTLTRYTAALSIISYLLAVYAMQNANLGVGDNIPGIPEIITMFAIIFVTYLTAMIILRRQEELLTIIGETLHLSKLDSLTSLLNHAAFYEQLGEQLKSRSFLHHPLTIFVLDIDNFKRINDIYGHNVGDDVILALVSCIRENMTEAEMAFRYGGEEFALISRQDAQACFMIAEGIRKDFARRSEAACGLQTTVSIGICQYSPDRFGAHREFFAAADEALYFAKRSGKNKSIVWREGMERNGAPSV